MSTKESFKYLRKIWAGATWSNFVRYWLGRRRTITEAYFKIRGYRKTGAIDVEDKRDFKLNIGEVQDVSGGADYNILSGGDDGVLQLNINFQDQGVNPWCVAFATAHHMSHLCTKLAHREITFSGESVWVLMVEWGLCKMDDNGTALRNGPKAIEKECKKTGYIKAIDGSKWYFDKYQVVLHKDFDSVMNKGCTIITGQMIRRPMCDKNNILLINGWSGHAFLSLDNGYNTKDLGLNSWRHWGIKIKNTFTGTFWILKSNRERLFYSSFILIGAREVS